MTAFDYSHLIGRTVMLGNHPVTVIDYNPFNNPAFAFEHKDGVKVFGWRENFYVPPTLEQIAEVLHNQLKGHCVAEKREAVAMAVLALLKGDE